MKTPVTLLFLLLSLSLSSFAKVLVISDIDDTLKISHVLDLTSEVENTIHIGNHFLGMSELFHYLQSPNGVEYAYVSNAPDSVMHTPHELFLLYNDFPDGGLFLRPAILMADFKMEIIPQLIKKLKPERVIMIGDNGEMDAPIYDYVRTSFPNIPMNIFIHQVYSKKNPTETGKGLNPKETGFVTSVDLAGEFQNLGLISAYAYRQFTQSFIPQILKEREDEYLGDLAFPDWVDCRDYQMPNSTTAPDQLLMHYQAKLVRRCHLQK